MAVWVSFEHEPSLHGGHLSSADRPVGLRAYLIAELVVCVIPRSVPSLRGKVVSRRDDFGQWIDRLSHFYEQKTGVKLYPGTLNVELPSEYSMPSDVIRLEAAEYGGNVSISIVPCRIFDRRAFLLRTDQNERGAGHHPTTIIEIASDVRLRENYQLEDGDWVEIEIP